MAVKVHANTVLMGAWKRLDEGVSPTTRNRNWDSHVGGLQVTRDRRSKMTRKWARNRPHKSALSQTVRADGLSSLTSKALAPANENAILNTTLALGVKNAHASLALSRYA
jgi:hypothetical protein